MLYEQMDKGFILCGFGLRVRFCIVELIIRTNTHDCLFVLLSRYPWRVIILTGGLAQTSMW